jgi:hypothetical protein
MRIALNIAGVMLVLFGGMCTRYFSFVNEGFCHPWFSCGLDNGKFPPRVRIALLGEIVQSVCGVSACAVGSGAAA